MALNNTDPHGTIMNQSFMQSLRRAIFGIYYFGHGGSGFAYAAGLAPRGVCSWHNHHGSIMHATIQKATLLSCRKLDPCVGATLAARPRCCRISFVSILPKAPG